MSDGNNNITIGDVVEALNNKVDTDLSNIDSQVFPSGIDYVVEWQVPTAENSYTWYRKYASGWIEQGGLYDKGATAQSFSTTITLPVTMQNSNYSVVVSVDGMAGDHLGEFGCNTESRTTTSFMTYYYTASSGDASQRIFWEVKGFAAA